MESALKQLEVWLSDGTKLPDYSEGNATEVISAQDSFSIPFRACNFIVCWGDKVSSNTMLLKSFTIPAAGVSWAQDEGHLFFPEPKLDIPSASITGYIHQKQTRNISNLYDQQFNNGLLSLKKGPTLSFFLYLPKDERDTSIATSLVSMAQSLAMMGSQDILGIAVNQALQGLDLSSSGGLLSDMGRLLYNKDLILPLISLRGCRFSPPSYSPDPSSNEFATVQLTVTYTSFSKDSTKLL